MAKTRVVIPGIGVPDLITNTEDGGASDVFVIENKIKAEEGNGQTERYEKYFEAVNKDIRSHPPLAVLLPLIALKVAISKDFPYTAGLSKLLPRYHGWCCAKSHGSKSGSAATVSQQL